MLTIPSLQGKWHPQTCSMRAARNPHSVCHKAQENAVCLVGGRKIRVQMEREWGHRSPRLPVIWKNIKGFLKTQSQGPLARGLSAL